MVRGATFAWPRAGWAAAPVFTAFAVLSLGVGVGVTTAAYSVVSTVFWTDSGIPDPATGVVIMSGDRVNDPRWTLSESDFEDIAAAQRSFSALTASLFLLPAVETPVLTEIHPGEGVDGRYFEVLGVRPGVGRFIQHEDTAPGSAPVVVLSHALWKSRFAEDSAIVGRLVRVNGQPFEVVGVAPQGFQGVFAGPMGTRIWMARHEAEALWFRNRPTSLEPRDRRVLTVFGRLRSGVDARSATADLRAIGAALDTRHPRGSADGSRPAPPGWSAWSVNELSNFDGMLPRFGMLMLGLVVLVLAVACTNLANLVLARGTTRHHEIAVRRALGASRWRLVREQVAESVLLALAGGLAAWPVLMVLRSALDVEIPMARNWLVSVQPEISVPALAVAGAALLLCLMVFGLEPALQLTRKTDVRAELVATAGSVGVPKVSRQRQLLRWQVAVSTGFFVLTSLCVRYLVIEARHDSGMDLERMAVARVAFGVQRWDDARARAAIDRILEEARREPGVEAVAASAGLPFGDTATPYALLAHATEPNSTRKPDGALAMLVSPGFFRATGIAIRQGRPIDERDQPGGLPVIVVGEGIARGLFGTPDVVGRQLLVTMDRMRRTGAENLPPTFVTIVGVAEDTDTTHFMLRRGSQVYLPLAQEYSPSVTFIARAEGPAIGVGALRTAARRAAPDLGLEQAGGGYAMLAGPYVFLRTIGIVALTLGGITLLLAMAGLFGVQSHLVGRRTREIGVRMSLGASPAQIRAMVFE